MCIRDRYRKANRNTEAAKILNGIAKDLIDRNISPLLIKKIFVLAGLEVNIYEHKMLNPTLTGGTTLATTTKTQDTLITSDINTAADKTQTNPWRGAEAWHFLILTQKQLYARNFKSALKTALRLQEYELELDGKRVYSIIALAAIYAKHFKECSRAFMKLETMPSQTDEEKIKYEELALNLFGRYPPAEPVDTQKFPCIGKTCDATISEFDINCKYCGSNFQGCVATGAPIFAKEYYKCPCCKHKMLYSAISSMNLKHCALCHNRINKKVQNKGMN